MTAFFICGSSFVFCLALTPLARRWAGRYGLVDRPDQRRKIHPKTIPVAGGLAVFLAVSGAFAVVWLGPSPLQDQLTQQGSNLLGLFLAALVICAVGIGDDLGYLRLRHKLLGQLLAIGIVMSAGLLVRSLRLFSWDLDLGLLAVPFTVFWLLGAVNSLNFIDGMDGLLSCVGVIISLAIAVMAFLGNQWVPAYVALALAGALLGFLCYNFPPASIFLGDSGSMLVGLVIGVLAMQSALKGPATIALAAPVAVLAIPILDTVAAILRRKLTGRRVSTTDRDHLHHCLLRRGLSSQRVLLVVSLFCLLTVGGALASLALQNELLAIVTVLAVAGILIVTRLFGYAEFLLLRNRLVHSAGSFFQGPPNGTAQVTEVRLAGTADWKQLWTTITECALPLNLQTIRLNVNVPALHEGYHAEWDRHGREQDISDGSLWRAEIPLTALGQTLGRLEITGQRDHEPIWMKIATLAKLVQDFEVALAMIASPPGNGLATNGELPTDSNAALTGFVKNAS